MQFNAAMTVRTRAFASHPRCIYILQAERYIGRSAKTYRQRSRLIGRRQNSEMGREPFLPTLRARVETVIAALTRFEPTSHVFVHRFLCKRFARAIHGRLLQCPRNCIAVLVGETDARTRTDLLGDLRAGRLTFLFTRDVLSEGLDVPEVNTVLFLRPTESLTVFLQQLGRGLRHSPDKDCVTVLDMVGQVHRRYRLDLKFKALLSKVRFNIEREVQLEFPHLPPGCSIQMDRVARDHVLCKYPENLRNLAQQVPERTANFSAGLWTATDFR